jgi:hypothetical protein
MDNSSNFVGVALAQSLIQSRGSPARIATGIGEVIIFFISIDFRSSMVWTAG